MPTAEPQVRITVGSRFENIDLIQIVVDDAFGRLGLGEDDRHWVGIAVREAVANAIKHGNREDPDKHVDVELRVEGKEAVIQVVDRGEGFEPNKVADPLAPENLLKPSGRGIFYMRRFMDEVSYRFRPGGGTVLLMRKRLGQGDLSEGDENKELKE
jgi:serine/threonine-protein kinase RsbW